MLEVFVFEPAWLSTMAMILSHRNKFRVLDGDAIASPSLEVLYLLTLVDVIPGLHKHE